MSAPLNPAHATTLLAYDPNSVTPGLLGFVVFCGLGVATWFLLKSMNSRFKRVDFAEEPESPKE